MMFMKEKPRQQSGSTTKRSGVIRQLSMLSSRGSSMTRDDSKCDRFVTISMTMLPMYGDTLVTGVVVVPYPGWVD